MRKKITLALLSLLLVPLAMMAQDVTISPKTGTILAALTGGNEGGSERGWGSTWRHQQLPLTFTIGDFGLTTKGGELRYPAGNMILNDGKNHSGEGGYDMAQALYTSRTYDKTNGNYVIMGGYCSDIFMALSLPKGYRFTGYEIVVANNMQGASTFGGWATYLAQNKILYETKDLTHNAAVTEANSQGIAYEDLYDNCDDVALYDAIYNAIKGGQDANYLAVAKKRVNGTLLDNEYVMGTTNSDDDYVITRTSKNDEDMGNHLYFRLSHSQDYNGDNGTYVALTIKSIKVFFSAEGDFSETVSTTSSTVFEGGKNYVNVPFATGKVDLGQISLDKHGHYTYLVVNQKDAEANNVLYQDGAVSGGALPETPGEGGITAEINGGNYYFGLKDDTYFVESPTTVSMRGGDDSQVGFRIIGAKVHYNYGTTTTESTVPVPHEIEVTKTGTKDHFYITYTSGSTTYYLNTSGRFVTGTKTEWESYTTGGNQYIRSGNVYLACEESGYYNTSYQLVAYTPNGYWDYNYYRVYVENENIRINSRPALYLQGTISSSTTPTFTTGTSNRAQWTNEPEEYEYVETETQTEYVTLPAFTPSTYTLTVYDKDGTTVAEEVKVGNGENESSSGTVTLSNLNNDAIKFAISGLDKTITNARALVSVELTMQALDPYIDQMTVVCTDPKAKTQTGTDENGNPIYEDLKITQDFTASDFSVSGGSFHFNLPEVCKTHSVDITFEDLFSHYADESYTGGSVNNFSRYNFVKSLHYNAFDGTGNPKNNIYNDYDEAADPELERLKVGIVGSTAFKFNNAAEVAAGSARYYVEYPFTLEAYETAGGSFDEMHFTVSETAQPSTGYVFTTDETAYNIAPTTATQHRSYAFYAMTVSVASKTYAPVVEFKPIYMKGDEVSGTVYGNRQQADFYGVVVTAPYTEGGETKQGYSQTDQIFAIIDAAVKGNTETGEVKDKDNNLIGTYKGWASGLASAEQLLYLDFSNLAGIFQVTTEQQGSMGDYSNTNAPNCLIFLPVGASAPNNNVAYKQQSGSFKAAHDIVLTDKQPFYSPYDITIDAANKAYYEREITVAGKGKVTSASIIMPFEISVDSEGKHTNVGDTKWAFSLHEMQAENCITDKDEEGHAASPGYVYFPALQGVKTTLPNHPYMVKVNEANVPSGATISFICSQSGATIKATTGLGADYTFTGSESTGTDPKDGSQFKFTAHGSYSGKLLPYKGYYYYYANNMFVRSNEYKYKSSIRVTPFRGYYSSSTNGAKTNLSAFDLIFGEGLGGQTDGLKAVETGKMVMDYNSPVYDMQGRKLANSLRDANLGKGMYVINGMKIIVK